MGPRGLLVACLLLGLGSLGIVLAAPPPVSSGTLVLQLRADAATVATNASGHVTAWTATNNSALVLTSTGNAPQQITFSATGMNGVPTLQFSDATGNDQWLRGDLPTGINLTDATVFWLGYYATAPDGSGNYVYSIGTSAGTGASQLSHQKDNGRSRSTTARRRLRARTSRRATASTRCGGASTGAAPRRSLTPPSPRASTLAFPATRSVTT